MPINTLFEPLPLARGPAMKNRFMLGPLTTQQSQENGRVSEEEIQWLAMRAAGGFALTMTAASHVQAVGQGFPGQLGVFSDEHLEGLTRLAAAIKANGSISSLQLHHAGMRAAKALVGTPVCPSDNASFGARGLTLIEVERLRDDFITAAKRAELSGFDGIQLHGAHGYILSQFLSPEINLRSDRYGGVLENRARIIFEIIDGIRRECGPDFQVGLRLSPERYGLVFPEICDIAAEVLRGDKVDYLDMSLWDVAKEPFDTSYRGRSILSYFTELPREHVRLGAAGKIMSADGAGEVMDAGCDFVVIGKGAILQHDFPKRVRENTDFESVALPVTEGYLVDEGIGSKFIDYLKSFPGFVK